MSRSAELFLGVIAAATLAMAIVQVGVIVVAGLLARRMIRLVDQVERDLRPLIDNVNAIGRDAARAASLAAAQVDRVDRLVTDLVGRVEQTELHNRAAVGAFRDARRARQRRADDEDALFI